MSANGDTESLAEVYRRRARELNTAARLFREDGDPLYAQELEAAAVDYTVAAEALEAGPEIPR
jgi:hypothetical protein